jgi:integrase
VRHTSWADLKGQIESYRAAWERAGHPGRGQVFVSAPTYLAETEAAARAEPRESIIHFYAEQAKLLEGAARLVDRETAARRVQRVHDLRRRSYEEAIEANALIGTPDAIADKLAALLCTDNPARGVKKAPVRKLERFLSEAEIARLAEALYAEAHHSGNPYPPAAIKLLLLTGCRKGEVVSLRWEHVASPASAPTAPRQRSTRCGRGYAKPPGSPMSGCTICGTASRASAPPAG